MLQNRRRGQPAGGQGRRSGALVPCLPPRCMYAQGPPPLNQKPAEQSARPPGEEQGPPLQQRQRHACALPPRASAPGGERLLPPLPGPPHQPTYASVGPQREYACGLYLPLRRLRGGEQAATAAATPADACLAGLLLPAGPGGPIKRSMRPASLRRCMASRTLMSSMECENTKYLPTKHC